MMEFEKAKKAVRRVLDQYAQGDHYKAAIIVAAALNDMSAKNGLAFKIGRLPLVYDVEEERKN